MGKVTFEQTVRRGESKALRDTFRRGLQLGTSEHQWPEAEAWLRVKGGIMGEDGEARTLGPGEMEAPGKFEAAERHAVIHVLRGSLWLMEREAMWKDSYWGRELGRRLPSSVIPVGLVAVQISMAGVKVVKSGGFWRHSEDRVSSVYLGWGNYEDKRRLKGDSKVLALKWERL